MKFEVMDFSHKLVDMYKMYKIYYKIYALVSTYAKRLLTFSSCEKRWRSVRVRDCHTLVVWPFGFFRTKRYYKVHVYQIYWKTSALDFDLP